jgi:hypothetical protein
MGAQAGDGVVDGAGSRERPCAQPGLSAHFVATVDRLVMVGRSWVLGALACWWAETPTKGGIRCTQS